MSTQPVSILTAAFLTAAAMASTLTGDGSRDVLARIFAGETAAFVLYDAAHDSYVRHDASRCAQRFSPYSTFKIPNTLIGLETGVIPDGNFSLAWNPDRDPQ